MSDTLAVPVDPPNLALAALRAPFPESAIEKRPVVTCAACLAGNCVDHEVKRCRACKRTVSEAHVHVPYLGHAVITERLNATVPEWWWEPLALDSSGLPAFTSAGGLWIRLCIPLDTGTPTERVATKLGYGTADAGATHRVKEVIGDALRNAAMRFGCGLELWKASVDQTVRPGRSGLPTNARHPLAGLHATIESVSGRRGRVTPRQIVDHYEAWVREVSSAPLSVKVPLSMGDADEAALERYIAALLAEPLAVPA